MNFANMVYNLKTSWIVFRAGWFVKAIHTIFDYLDNNAKNDRQVARAYANWKVTNDDEDSPKSGRPPSLDALEGYIEENYKYFEREPNPNRRQYHHHAAVYAFSEHLFQKYLDADLIDKDTAYLLTAVVLLRFRAFLELLITHPENLYGVGHVLVTPYRHFRRDFRQPDNPNSEDPHYQDYNMLLKHPFVARLHQICKTHLSGDLSLLLHWGVKIEADFVRCNWTFVSEATLLRSATNDQSDLMRVDTRSVVDHLRLISTHLWDLKEETSANTRELNALKQLVPTRLEVSIFQKFIFPMYHMLEKHTTHPLTTSFIH